MLANTRLQVFAMMHVVVAAFHLELYDFSDTRPVRPDATANSGAIFCNRWIYKLFMYINNLGFR